MKPKDNAINRDPQELQDPHWLWSRKLTLFGFLVIVMIDWMTGIDFQRKNLVLEGLILMLPVT